MIVLKFGGTSMGDAEAMARAASIVRTRLDRGAMVVVSAMSGTTNALLEVAEQASRGQLIVAIRLVEGIRERHLAAAAALLGECQEADELCAELSALCDELAGLAEALSVLGHLTPRSVDAIAAYGEQLSAPLAAAALGRHRVPVQVVDAREVIVTDDTFTRAAPQHEAIAQEARRVLLPIVRAGEVPVMGGFIGATAQGVTTTLGRGGSDFSAALVGSALDAAAIEIWTDVDGMLTGDPRVVEGARLIEQIRFDEAAELSAFGAKVLHPATIAPAVRRGIPVYVYNSRRPEGRGTRITADAPRRAVTAVAGKGDVTVLRVRTPRMLHAHGTLRRIFEAFERHRVSVDVVATSEVSVTVTLDDPARLEEVVMDLMPLGDVAVERDRAILAVVGSGLGDGGRTMARALGALGDERVHMISLSATQINLTLVVDGDRLKPGMRQLHAAFFGEDAAAAPVATLAESA
ncbi:MAG TPA: lysine-sensitive aspartokinase 3 [Gemmatimonadales bacterium]